MKEWMIEKKLLILILVIYQTNQIKSQRDNLRVYYKKSTDFKPWGGKRFEKVEERTWSNAEESRDFPESTKLSKPLYSYYQRNLFVPIPHVSSPYKPESHTLHRLLRAKIQRDSKRQGFHSWGGKRSEPSVNKIDIERKTPTVSKTDDKDQFMGLRKKKKRQSFATWGGKRDSSIAVSGGEQYKPSDIWGLKDNLKPYLALNIKPPVDLVKVPFIKESE